MVLHDHNGILQAAASYSYLATSSPEVAEILACRSRLQLAQELNIQKVHVELDCKGVALMLNCHANDQGKASDISGIKGGLGKTFSK